jgi:hypothetical protein
MGKKIHLCDYETDNLAENLNSLFGRNVEIPRIKVGNRQTLETLINEEALLLAKFLRNEIEIWHPRVAGPLNKTTTNLSLKAKENGVK